MCGFIFTINSNYSYDKYTLYHRGPDNFSTYEILKNNVKYNFYHYRLNIVDNNVLSNQPFIEDNKVLIFNGEIYNYKELMLKISNDFDHRFKTCSDTEVLFYGLVYYGVDFIKYCIGMFSFVFYDKENGESIIARDQFGIKPLYYDLDYKLFSSEIKSFKSYITLTENLYAKGLYFNGIIVNPPNTFFNEIKQLEPGNYILLRDGVFKGEFKLPSYELTNSSVSLKELCYESVLLHTQSHYDFCCTLSGGIDSTAIVSYLKDINKSFLSYTFDSGSNNSELNWAKYVSLEKKIPLKCVKFPKEEFDYYLDKTVIDQEEPFISPSIVMQNYLYREISNRHRIVLGGQGADEMFCGYTHYPLNTIKTLIDTRKYRSLIFFLFSNMYKYKNNTILMLLICLIKNDIKSLKSVLDNECILNKLPTLLRYDDKNSMAHSIESRVPFCNQKIYSFIKLQEEEYLIDRYSTTKTVLRNAFKDNLPLRIYNRSDKVGFEASESFNKSVQFYKRCYNIWKKHYII